MSAPQAFSRFGLDGEKLAGNLLRGAKNGGDFIRIVMNEIAQAQNVGRWAVYDPDNVLYMRRIKAEIPEALFVHIVRDGRDIALSLKTMGEFGLFRNRKPASLEATALYWKWMVENRQRKRQTNPRRLSGGSFRGTRWRTPTDAENSQAPFWIRIWITKEFKLRSWAGCAKSNSSFREGGSAESGESLEGEIVLRTNCEIEALVGDCLSQYGYNLVTNPEERAGNLRHKYLKVFYPAFLNLKQWLKINTPAGKLTNISALELSDAVSEESEKAESFR